MNLEISIIAIIWGVLSGYLILRTLESGLAIIFCLHGLLMTRWKRLVNKAAPGQIKYSVSLRQLFRVALLGSLLVLLLEIGNNFVQRGFNFSYQGSVGILWGTLVILVTLLLLRSTWRRLIIAWKMTHEVDYAEKRKRTSLLKG